MGRDPAMLTPDQRQYLRREKDYNTAVENNTRYAIRKRVRNTLTDFGLLLEWMEPRDRKQIFKDIRPASRRDDNEMNDEELREDELGGLVHTLGFLYLGVDNLDIPFENAMEQGIFAALGAAEDNPFVARYTKADIEVDIEIDIEEELETDLAQIFQKIEDGKPLNEFEYFGAARVVLDDLDKFVRLGNDVDIEVISLLEAGEELTRGDSLVVVAHTLDEPEQFHEFDLLELLHDDVISHLGLSNVMQPD